MHMTNNRRPFMRINPHKRLTPIESEFRAGIGKAHLGAVDPVRQAANQAAIARGDPVAMQAVAAEMGRRMAIAYAPPVASSAVINMAPLPLPAPTSSYSPYQTNYVVAPGIPDTGETGIPGTGTGAPSAPMTYSQVMAAPQSAAAPTSNKWLWVGGVAAIAGYFAYQNRGQIKRALKRH